VEDNPRADIRKFIAANAGSARAQG
jgi:hypothetical protein